MMLIQHSVNSGWPLNTLPRVLQADWLILVNDEKATLSLIILQSLFSDSLKLNSLQQVLIGDMRI